VKVGFLYYLLCTVMLALIFFSYLLRSNSLQFMDIGGWVYFTVSCLSHAALFSAIPFIVLYLPAAMLGAGPKWSGSLMCVGEVLLTTLFIINGMVYTIYHFHINGLVINMLTGPGAGEIFVFSPWLYLKISLYLLCIIGVCVLLLWGAFRLSKHTIPHLWRNGLLAILAATLLAQGMHIYAAIALKRSVLESTAYLPYYFPLRMNSTFTKWGLIDGDKLDLEAFDKGDANINYPLNPLQVNAPDTLFNILIIGIDSWNYRTMTPECTPAIYGFSQQAERYDHHFSCSNGTRGGVFGLFTGLSSYYWDSFEYSNTQPLLVTEALRLGYQAQVYASATLADPPFAKMLFADIPDLNVSTAGETAYDRDCQITRNFIADLDKHDSTKPFFSFIFYDLPHAITLSEEKLTHFQPSWKYADYTQLDNDLDPTPFFNLYRNCVWQVDSLASQVFTALQAHDLMKNTVIVITGDHGQEFNENHKNYWGHWANYSRPQIGVPLVYYYPGCLPAVRSYRTTHYDISATLLKQVMGVQNPTEDYSMGKLLEDPSPRPWHVAGNDLFYAFIIDDDVIVEKRGTGNIVIFDKQMNQLDDYQLNVKELNDAIIRLNRFYK